MPTNSYIDLFTALYQICSLKAVRIHHPLENIVPILVPLMISDFIHALQMNENYFLKIFIYLYFRQIHF